MSLILSFIRVYENYVYLLSTIMLFFILLCIANREKKDYLFDINYSKIKKQLLFLCCSVTTISVAMSLVSQLRH